MKTISHETTPKILTKHYIPKKTSTSKDRIKREQTARKYPICTEEGTGRKRVAGAGSEWRRSGLRIEILFLLFGYGNELVWSILGNAWGLGEVGGEFAASLPLLA